MIEYMKSLSEYAEKLGKAVSEMTQEEKESAMLNATMKLYDERQVMCSESAL